MIFSSSGQEDSELNSLSYVPIEKVSSVQYNVPENFTLFFSDSGDLTFTHSGYGLSGAFADGVLLESCR